MDQDQEEVMDFTKLRYALYLRKSTDDKERQQRSIEDQKAECIEMAARIGLTIVKPYYEDHRSAKIANNRPDFTRMLEDLQKGKFDAILAWHPDRIARNMEDGGQIFNLIDKKTIKDLKFVTHYFTNDASGKMLLGISFTLATYYSANLAQNVKRSFKRSLQEGISSGTPKHGYIRTEEGIYMPDSKNFDLVKEAWQMRLRGHGLREISDWLNENDYRRIIKDKKSKNYGKKILMTFQTLSDVFKDPFYYGVLFQTGKQVNLCDAYGFTPMINEDEYNEVQRLTGTTVSRFIQNKRRTYYPLRGLIKCAYCDHNMSPGASKGQHGDRKRYLYYRCINSACTRTKKSIRAIKIFEAIYMILGDGVELDAKDYAAYQQKLVSQSDRDSVAWQTELRSKEGSLKAVKSRIKRIGEKLIDYSQDSPVWKINHDRLLQLETERKTIEARLAELRENKVDPKKDLLTIEQFLNLAKKASIKVKAANETGKDRICRIIFLNLYVDELKVTDYQLTKAFSKLKKLHSVRPGQRDYTRT